MLQSINHSNRAVQVIMAILFSAALFVGCSSKSTAPSNDEQEPTPVVKKPVSIVINSIEVSSFKNKSWDAGELITAWKKADVWVSLGRKGASADFKSNTVFDASPSSSHTFTKAGGVFGSDLPKTYSYVDDLVVTVWDYDVFSDEKIAAIALSPSKVYGNDEATTFKVQLTGSNSTKIIVRGNWKY